MDILQYINKMNRLYGNDPTPVRYNTQQYLQGGRVGYQSGQLVQPGPGRQGYGGKGSGYSLDELFPKLEKRAIQLLNSGLAPVDVSRQLEEEGIIKVKAYERKPRPGRGDTPGRMKKSYKPFNEYYKKLLADNKLKITEIPKTVTGSLKSQAEITKLDDVIVKTFKNNPDLSAERIAQLVSTKVNQTIGQGAITNALKRADIDYVGKGRKILPEIEALDKIIKNNANLLNVSPESTIGERRKFVFDEFKKAIGNKNLDPDTFGYRLQRLGKLYSGTGEDRTTAQIYKNIKAPKNYLGSPLHQNLIGMVKAQTRGIIGTAELLGLPQKDINLLKDMQKGARALAGGITIQGDHTDIDALMKNFPKYRQNFMRINYIKGSLNNLKSKTDQAIVKLFKEAKDLEGDRSPQAIRRRNEIVKQVKNLRSSFMADTGLKVGGFKLDKTGKPSMSFTTERISDIDSPRWTKLRELSGHLGQKPTNVVDQLITKGKNIKKILTDWKGTSEIADSKFIESFSKMGGKWGKLTKALIAGTIGAGGISTLAAADTGVQQAGSMFPEAAAGAGAAGLAYKYRKPIMKGVGKALALAAVPLELGFMGAEAEQGKSPLEVIASPLMLQGTARENRIRNIMGDDSYQKFLQYHRSEADPVFYGEGEMTEKRLDPNLEKLRAMAVARVQQEDDARKEATRQFNLRSDETMFKSGGKVDYDNYLPDIDDDK